MPKYVKRIEAKAVHGRFNLVVNLQPGINIVHGKNGAGKTTLIHILANALNGEFTRFLFLEFDSIAIHLNDSRINIRRTTRKNEPVLVVTHDKETLATLPTELASSLALESGERWRMTPAQLTLFDEEFLSPSELHAWAKEFGEFKKETPILPSAYYPAFRTMIDAWASAHKERGRRDEPDRWTDIATRSARKWFGEFVPSISYPSLLEIEKRLTDEIHSARLKIGRADREYLSEAFLDIFASLSRDQQHRIEESEPILQEIRILFDRLEESPLQEDSMLVTRVYSQLRESIHDLDLSAESERTAARVLNVYRALLEKIVDVQEKSFLGIQRYLGSVNQFLEDKQLVVDLSNPRHRGGAVGIDFDSMSHVPGLGALSSGERQIVTLIYAATHMAEQQVVLIDEPELSLHVDWQRQLLRRMSEQIGERQIIACTHSPVVAADYENRLVEICLEPVSPSRSSISIS